MSKDICAPESSIPDVFTDGASYPGMDANCQLNFTRLSALGGRSISLE